MTSGPWRGGAVAGHTERHLSGPAGPGCRLCFCASFQIDARPSPHGLRDPSGRVKQPLNRAARPPAGRRRSSSPTWTKMPMMSGGTRDICDRRPSSGMSRAPDISALAAVASPIQKPEAGTRREALTDQHGPGHRMVAAGPNASGTAPGGTCHSAPAAIPAWSTRVTRTPWQSEASQQGRQCLVLGPRSLAWGSR